MTSWIRSAWQGKQAAWKVILGLIVLPWVAGTLIWKSIGIGWFLDWTLNGQFIYIVGVGGLMWGGVIVGNICLWRCAMNVKWKLIGYAIRGGAILLWGVIIASVIATTAVASKNRRVAHHEHLSQSSSRTSQNVPLSPEEQLFEAAKAGKVQTVKVFLDGGLNVNLQDKKSPNVGRTALHYAAGSGHQALVEFLLHRGAEIDARADTGYTPLHVASGLSQKAIVEVLIGGGANVNAKDVRGTPLHAAVIRGDVAITDLLLKSGSDPNATNAAGETPLHAVSGTIIRTEDHKKIVKSLISKGGNINAMSGAGETPIIHALSHENDGIAAALVESGADVNMTGKSVMQVPLTKAAIRCSLNLMELMVKHGAVVLQDGYTPIHAVSQSPSCRDRQKVLAYLLEHGGNVRAKSSEGLTALHIATSSDVAQFLIKNGAVFSDN